MHCPNCKVDLEGGLIFDYFAKLYSKEKALDIAAMYGATETEGRWGRQIGIETPEYDGISYWRCREMPDNKKRNRPWRR